MYVQYILVYTCLYVVHTSFHTGSLCQLESVSVCSHSHATCILFPTLQQ